MTVPRAGSGHRIGRSTAKPTASMMRRIVLSFRARRRPSARVSAGGDRAGSRTMTRILIRSEPSLRLAYSHCTRTQRPAGPRAFPSVGVSVRPRGISLSNGEVASAFRTTCTDECRRVKPIAAMPHMRCDSTEHLSTESRICDNLVSPNGESGLLYLTGEPRFRSLVHPRLEAYASCRRQRVRECRPIAWGLSRRAPIRSVPVRDSPDK